MLLRSFEDSSQILKVNTKIMIKQITLPLSTRQVLPRFIGGQWNHGKASKGLQRSFFNGDGGIPTSVISPYRGRISWIGSLSDKTVNGFSVSEVGVRSLGHSSGHFRLSPLHRMLSTSSASNTSVSKKQDNSEDDTIAEEKPEPSSFRSMMKKYGKVFITTYFAVYVSTVLGLFMSVQSGQIDAMYMISLLTGTSSPSEPGGVADPDTIKEAASAMKDLVELLESYTLTKPFAPMVEEYPWTANFAIAWIATKFTEPIRFGATVVLTPPIARFFGYSSTPTAVRKGPIDIVGVPKDDDASSSTQSSSTR